MYHNFGSTLPALIIRQSRPVIVTARITYGLPDNLDLVQDYIWQEFDESPGLPEFRKFLTFWQRKLEGPIRKVRYTIGEPVWRRKLSMVESEKYLQMENGKLVPIIH